MPKKRKPHFSQNKDVKKARAVAKKPQESVKNLQDRRNPWRVQGGRVTGESLLLGLTLVVMFVGAFGIGWALGGALRQRPQHGEAVQLEQSDQGVGAESSGEELEQNGEPEKSQDEGRITEQEQVEEEKSGEEPKPIPQPDITDKKLIALTFDDGPSGAITEQLLTILRQKQVRATFFVIGYMAERSPGQLQKQVSEGHEVGSHTVNHTAFSKMSAADLASDTLCMNQIFTNILGQNTPFMRPPYGDGAYTEKARTSVGQPMILWTVDTLDWKYRDAATVRQNAVKDAFDGAIILFHDVYQSTVDAIPGVIDDLRAQGYEFLTVSELAKARGTVMQNGAVYGSFIPR